MHNTKSPTNGLHFLELLKQTTLLNNFLLREKTPSILVINGTYDITGKHNVVLSYDFDLVVTANGYDVTSPT